MPGMLDWKIKISADIKDLQNKMHKVEGELGEFEGKDHKVKLDLDTKTLESALKKLDSMLDSLGKGTGDFKQFETLSKDLAKVTSELSGFTKAFGKIDNSGTKSLLDMIQNIDKSLNNLSSHITDVAKNLGNIGKDSGASSAVAQIENITKANEEAIKSTEKLAEARKKINDNVSVSTKGTSFTSNTSALQQEEKQIQKNINSLNKLLALKSDVKNVKKSSYSGKGNLDYVGIYHSQEEAVSKDLATKSNKLNASLNLILNEDKDAVQELESEVTKLKTSLQSVQDLTKRISKNSSINDLTKEQDVTERLKGYASAYQAIDTRLGELNNEYSLSNKQLEEYITLQAKAEKIMNEVSSNEFGGVRGYGDVTSKAQLKMLVEESFAKRLGYDSQDIYDGLFKNISDANYESKHISLFGDNGKKRSLKEVSAQILDYKSSVSSLSGVFGANEDIERLNTLNSILNYIKTNEKEIANTDFTAQINRLTAMLENTSGLTFLEEELQELKSYQERLDSVKNTSIDSASTSSSISEQNKVQEELKETQTQAKKTKEALNESNISSGSNPVIEQQNKLQEELKETQDQAEKTAQSVKNAVSQTTKKDAFPKTSENLEQVAQSEQKVQQEAVATDKALDNISFTPNTEEFEDIIAKFGILREQAEQITKIVKTTKQTADGAPDISYKATLKNGSSYYLGENSTPQVLNASETVYDAKAIAKNAEQEAKAIQAEWDKNIKAIQDYMDAVTKLNNLKAKDKGTGSEENQIALQIQNVEELKQVAFEARQNLSSMQAENPDIIAWKQWVDMMELFDQASKGSAESAAKLKDVLDNIKAPSLDKYENKLASYQTKTSGYNATIARFKDGGWTSDEYLKNVQAVENAVQKYEDLLSNIKAKGGITSEEDVQKLKEYESEIKKTISTVTNMSAAEKGYNFVSGQKELDKIHKLLAENTKMSAEAKAKIKSYYAEIESGNPSMSLDKIHGEILKIYNAEVEAGRAGRTLWDTLKNSRFHQIAAQMAGMFGVYDVINLGRQAISTIVDLDDALLDLKKTTSMSSTELNNFYYSANDVAKQMGVTTKSIIDQASAWSRLGYSSNEQATEMAKLSSKFASISPGMDTDQAQEGMVSIMKAWQINPEDVEKEILDPINQLGNKFAESNDDIVEGMKRSAAALAAVGTDYKDAYSLFTGVQEVLQNSEVAGRALRSISMRIRGYDENSEDGFEQTDDELKNITGDLIDLTKTANHAQGVSIFKEGSTTEFKSLVDYFGEIHDIWDEMSQKQQNDFLQKAFGKTQAQAGAALIQNYDAVKEALAEIDESAGSADKEMSTVEQTLSYKINALKETWVGCVQQILDRGDLGIAISGLNGVSKVITGLIDNVGLLKTAAMGVAAALSFKNVGRDKMYSLSF